MASPTDQATVYHERLRTLADEKRPVLLILDDASASSQVRDLLPRQLIHRTLVTTRESWSLPSTRELDLDVLTDADALELLRASLRTRRQDDPRLTLDPRTGRELADLCGHLPLAVEIAAAILADEPDLSLRELSDDLTDAESRLDTLRHADKKVITVVDVSWQRLRGRDAEAANLLPLLTVNPGADLATETAGALANRSATST